MSIITALQRKKQQAGFVAYKNADASAYKAETNGRVVMGYLNTFGNKDSAGDVSIKGCFAKSINDRGPGSSTANKIVYLLQHDMKSPLAKFKVLVEDGTGLYFETNPIDETQAGEDALTGIKSGTLGVNSIGFTYVWDKVEYDETNDAFMVKEYNLFEGSVVTLACNDQSIITGVKGEETTEDVHADLETFFRSLSPIKAYELRQLITKQMALAATQPVEDLKQLLKTQPAATVRKSMFANLSTNKIK